MFLGLSVVFCYHHLEADDGGPIGKYIGHCPWKVEGKDHKLKAVGEED
jgi:hypothetical protein